MVVVLVVLLVAFMVGPRVDQRKLEKVQALDILMTRVTRWHRLQERLFEGPMPARYELLEAQTDLTDAITGLRVILE